MILAGARNFTENRQQLSLEQRRDFHVVHDEEQVDEYLHRQHVALVLVHNTRVIRGQAVDKLGLDEASGSAGRAVAALGLLS